MIQPSKSPRCQFMAVRLLRAANFGEKLVAPELGEESRDHVPCRRPYYFFWQKATSFPLELRKLTVGRPCGEWYME